MKYKLIAMDFDGTLVNDQKKVTPRTIEALKKKKEENYKIVGVTARALESSKNIGDMSFFDYLILNNGAYLYQMKTEKGDYINKISQKDAKRITELLEDELLQIDYCSGERYYIYKNQNKENPSFIKSINRKDEIPSEIAKINIFLKSSEKIETYKEKLIDQFPNISCFIMQDSNDIKKWLVLTPRGVNKKITLERLGKNLGIRLEEMIYFGDAPNDIEVISKVGCGVAMGNVLLEVKQHASYITASNNEDGIAIFLENLKKKDTNS